MTLKPLVAAVLVVSGLAAAGATLARNPPADPTGGGTHDFDIQYYADAAMTQRVGGERYTCSGEHLSWGTTGPYRFTSSLPCE